MKLYLADTGLANTKAALLGLQENAQAPFKTIPRLLLSYHYAKKKALDELLSQYFSEKFPEVFLDSGAFSAANLGAVIDIAAYCKYIARFRSHIEAYANLDVIGDAAGTASNQAAMERSGLVPLPVFHVGESWHYLEAYIERYPYIALGGMVPYMFNKKELLLPWLVRCFKLADGKSVYHGFGCTSLAVMRVFPWYSVDSTCWISGVRFGRIYLFDQKHERIVQADLRKPQTCYKFAHFFRELGFDPKDFAERSRHTHQHFCAISALTFLQLECWLERKHGVIALPKR